VWDEIQHKGDFSAIDELFDPQFIRHDLDPSQGQGRKHNEEFIRRMRSTFPDLHFSIDDVIAKGDKVVTRYHFDGTHLGDALGFKATGKKVAYTGILIQRFENGKIVEQWTEANLLSLFRQLGIVPSQKQ
jgi:predicted ester cyclase